MGVRVVKDVYHAYIIRLRWGMSTLFVRLAEILSMNELQ